MFAQKLASSSFEGEFGIYRLPRLLLTFPFFLLPLSKLSNVMYARDTNTPFIRTVKKDVLCGIGLSCLDLAGVGGSKYDLVLNQSYIVPCHIIGNAHHQLVGFRVACVGFYHGCLLHFPSSVR